MNSSVWLGITKHTPKYFFFLYFSPSKFLFYIFSLNNIIWVLWSEYLVYGIMPTKMITCFQKLYKTCIDTVAIWINEIETSILSLKSFIDYSHETAMFTYLFHNIHTMIIKINNAYFGYLYCKFKLI